MLAIPKPRLEFSYNILIFIGEMFDIQWLSGKFKIKCLTPKLYHQKRDY